MELDVGIGELGLGLRDRSLLAVYGRLEWRFFERVEQVALLDVGALHKKLFVQPGRHTRYDVYAVGRLDPAVELVTLGHRLTLHRDHSDCGGTGRRGLCHCTWGDQS